MTERPSRDMPGDMVAARPETVVGETELVDATAGRLLRAGSRTIHGAAVDSRRVQPGNVFFALPGERSDGHDHLAAAVAAGAAAVVVTRDLDEGQLAALDALDGGASVVRVQDAAEALRSLAATYRARFDPLVVGITGSLAKTSTKEQVATLLSARFEVHRNEGNENNEIGLPLTLLRLHAGHEVAVLEMGLYTTGEIALLAGLARPAIGVVTAVRGVHLSRAGSIEAIEAGKRELVEALPPSGTAILNADDARVAAMADHTPARVLTYGFSEEADIRADSVRSLGEAGMRFSLQLPSGRHEVRTPVLGRHGVHNALAAAAVALVAGMSADEIVPALAREVHVPHRSQLVQAGAWTILDDSYNASPDAVIAALDLLAELPGRSIAVLGEMLELGDPAAEEHLRVGRHVAGTASRLLVVGDGARGIAEGALDAGMAPADVSIVADRDAALATLLAELREGDRVLVKASRGAALDLLVDRLVLAAQAGEARA